VAVRLWLLIGGLVVVAIVPRLGDDGPHTPRPGSPETVAAAVALTYARGVQVGDTTIACGTMTVDAARAVGCGTANAHPRGCGDFSIPSTKITDYDDARAEVEVGTCRIELVPGARTQWAVAAVR
jgi:hypothetical protein